MSGPLCDHALEVEGSLAQLRALESSSLLVQAIDHAATHYRYHPLLRDLLREELEAEQPNVARGIAARAAMWCHAEGEPLEALEYARRSDDRELVAALLAQEVWPLHWTGRIATIERWIEWFDRDGVRDRYPTIAVLAGFICAIDGRRLQSELWLSAAERSLDRAGPMPDGSTAEAWVAVLRGMVLANGAEAAEADARLAEAGMQGDSPFMPGVRLLSAVASMLAGRYDEAANRAREAVELAEVRGAMPGFAMATGLEVSLALRSGHRELARKRIEHALSVIRRAGLEEYVLTAWVHALAARVAISAGSTNDARRHLAQVHRLRPLSTAATPWLGVPTRLEAIEALIALQDVASARTLMREVDDILRVRPRLGSLVADAEAMRGRLDRMSEAGVAQWTLTAAELRVLQYLPTHLTFAEIAERLYVSPHTVKSQAVAIYSKLGVSSRRAAIETAVEYGLIDGSALRFPLGPGVENGIG
jgi:LuxR family maltose regulon positive regulatory protein